MVLSHRDDVCDHAKWAKALGCQRIIHKVGAAVSGENGLCMLAICTIHMLCKPGIS